MNTLPEIRTDIERPKSKAYQEIITPRTRKLHPYMFMGLKEPDRIVYVKRECVKTVYNKSLTYSNANSMKPIVKPAQVLKIVAGIYGIKESEMLKGRKQPACTAKFMYIYLLREVGRYSWEDIAKAGGYGNHSSPLVNCSSFKNRLSNDESTRVLYDKAHAELITLIENENGTN